MLRQLKHAVEARFMDGQYRQPSGLLGRYVGASMARDHLPENLWTVDCLDPQATDRILEIGFGPGFAVQALASRVTSGLVAGIDFSPTMVGAARRRNGVAVRAGRVDLRYGYADLLPFPDRSFDKVFGIHTVYFWPRPDAALREAWRVLRPGGQMVLTILPREKWNPADPAAPTGTPECHPYAVDELMQLYTKAGFVRPHVHTDPDPQHPSSCCVIAIKPD